VEIQIADEDDKDLWDSLCNSSQQGTIFHTWDWLKLIERYNKFNLLGFKIKNKLYPIIVFDGDSPIGLFPLFVFKNPLIKLVASPPFTGVNIIYLGPIFVNEKGLRTQKKQVRYYQFISKVDRYIRETFKPRIIYTCTSPGFIDPRTFTWQGYEVRPLFTYSVGLEKGEKAIWEGFTKVVRKNIRKVTKLGIVVREGNRADYNKILALLKTRDRLKMSYDYSQAIFETFFPEKLKIFVAEKDGEVLSGLILLAFKGKLSAWVGTPRSEFKGISPNTSIGWDSIRWAIENDFEKYEIMGASDLSLFQWKRKFGLELEQYYDIRYYSNLVNLAVTIKNMFARAQVI
jgi:hypothetical protein